MGKCVKNEILRVLPYTFTSNILQKLQPVLFILIISDFRLKFQSSASFSILQPFTFYTVSLYRTGR